MIMAIVPAVVDVVLRLAACLSRTRTSTSTEYMLKVQMLNIIKRECASYLWKSISQLRSVTCRMGSHSVTFHPTQANTPRLHPSQTDWYSSIALLNQSFQSYYAEKMNIIF